MSNFIIACLEGDAFLEDIDDYIDQWHDGDSTESIYDFLGMTKIEYTLWVTNQEVLPSIIRARKLEEEPLDYVQKEVSALAARAETSEKAKHLEQWLKHQGFLT